MFRFVGRVVRKAFELATRRILREALASAIVTIVVTAAFTGFATRSEPSVPPALVSLPPEQQPAAPRTEVAVAAPVPAASEYSKVWFDPNAVAPNPTGFRRTTSAALPRPSHRRTAAARPAPATARPAMQASIRADEKALGHAHATDALAMASPPPAKRFRVWGVAPADLIPSVPSASSILKGVKSVSTTVVGLMPSL